jgi:hypothetical protein
MPRRKSTIGKNPLDAVAPPMPAAEPAQPAAPTPAGAPPAAGPPAVGRQVFEAWASGTQRALRASFEAQHAALAAGLSVVEATSDISRAALDEWTELGRQAQQAVLDAFRRATRDRPG